MDRTELLDSIRSQRELLEDAFRRLDAAKVEQPNTLYANWSPKDLLAHLAFWEERAYTLLTILQSGSQPQPYTEGETLDQVNARAQAEFAALPLEEVQSREADAYTRLLNLVEQSPDADLFDPGRFAWTENRPFYHWITGNTSEHYEEHLPELTKLLGG